MAIEKLVPFFGSIPNGWVQCDNYGQVIEDMFLPTKTPLSSAYDTQLVDNQRFTIPRLLTIDYRIGLLIDLTKTDRFYNGSVLGELYHKIPCQHGEDHPPTVEEVKNFIDVCSHFLRVNDGNIITVHCVHGYNRTGFMIISYLVREKKWSFKNAVEAFSKARPPGIYKRDFLAVLAERVNGGDMVDITVPERLWWDQDGLT